VLDARVRFGAGLERCVKRFSLRVAVPNAPSRKARPDFASPDRFSFQDHTPQEQRRRGLHGSAWHDQRAGVHGATGADCHRRKLDHHILHCVRRQVAALARGSAVADRDKVELERRAVEEAAVSADCGTHGSKTQRREESALHRVRGAVRGP